MAYYVLMILYSPYSKYKIYILYGPKVLMYNCLFAYVYFTRQLITCILKYNVCFCFQRGRRFVGTKGSVSYITHFI